MAAPALRVLEASARTYRHVWKGSVFSSFVNPALFLLAMGLGLGTLVDRGATAETLPGGSYLAFLAPGLLAATAMQTAASEASWPVMAGLKWVKTYHAALATPLRTRDLLHGMFGWATIRLVMTCVVYVVVMALFGAASLGRGLAAVAPAVLTGLAFAMPITAFTATLENDVGLSSLFRFVIMPLYLFSGTFFPISQLPEPLQVVALISPLWHGVELTRALAIGTPTAAPPLVHVGVLAAIAAVGLVLAQRQFHRRIVT